MDEAEYCNRLTIMVDGKIEALGSPQELKQQQNANTMEAVFLGLARRAFRSEIQ